MYEVLDIKRMMTIKSPTVRSRSKPPQRRGGTNAQTRRWGGVFLISAGTSMDKLQHIPEGSDIKLCLQDRSLWEVMIPEDYEKNKKRLAERLNAIAFM